MTRRDLMQLGNVACQTPRRRRRTLLSDPFDTGLSSLIDDFFSGGFFVTPRGMQKKAEARSFVPQIDVQENESSYVVTAEVPGMEENDFDITLNEDSLVLSGEKSIERKEEKEGEVHYFERRSGSFERVIPLRVQVEEDKVDAQYKNGVLTVTLPKMEEEVEKSWKISVRS